jgi:hypothetical protein
MNSWTPRPYQTPQEKIREAEKRPTEPRTGCRVGDSDATKIITKKQKKREERERREREGE